MKIRNFIVMIILLVATVVLAGNPWGSPVRRPYTCIWTEEGGTLNAEMSGREHSFGNGDMECYGLTQAFSGKIVAMTIQIVASSGASTGEVFIMKNGASAGGEYHLHCPTTDDTGDELVFSTPLSFAAGDTLGFITVTADSSVSGVVMCMWIVYD